MVTSRSFVSSLALVLSSAMLAGACGSSPPGATPQQDGGVATADGGAQTADGGAPDAGPTTCTEDATCGSGRVCESNVCIAACGAGNECQGGFTVTCVDGHCRSRCFNDQGCPSGQVCTQFTCTPAECSIAKPCTGTNRRCTDGRCETFTPCTSSAECPANFICDVGTGGTCEELPRCLGDGNCQDAEICEDGHCRTAAVCANEAACTAAQDCVGGLCVPHVCRGNSECQAPQVCSGGACVAPGNTTFIFRVVILTPGGVVRRGETRPLVALALDQTDRPVEGTLFDWTSSHPEFVRVDATTGVISGGDQAGSADIRATARGTTIRSDAVSFRSVVDLPASTMRVTLIDRVSGLAVGPAKLLVGTELRDVDATGIVTFTAPTGAVDLTAFHATHDYLTVMKTTSLDLVLALQPRSALDPAAGLTGTIDLSQVSTSGPVSLGLAGLSTARTISDLDFTRLFGDLFTSQVSIPSVGTFDVPLPGGFTLSAEVIAGFRIDVKTDYFAQGDSGLRAAWSMGGHADIGEIASVFGGGGGGGGGGISVGSVLQQILPLFERFDHGVLPAVGIQAIPLVVDADDVDGDLNTTERVPDWDNFRDMTLQPRQKQTLRTEVVFPALPRAGGMPVQGASLFAGVQVPGTGFVPLGISGSFDDAGTGTLDPLIMKSAPVHSGLGVGTYSLLALAADFTGAALPTTFSASIATFEAMPTEIALPPFPKFPEGATYTPTTRALSIPPVSNTHIYRVVFQGIAGAWEVLSPAQETTLSLTLPTLPSGVGDDLSTGAAARIDALVVSSPATLDSIAGSTVGLQNINAYVRGFSRASVTTP